MNRRTRFIGSDGQVPDVVQRLNIAAPADQILLAGQFDDAATNFAVTLANGLDHFRDGDAIRQQLVGVDGDLIVLYEAAHRRHFRHARYAFQPVA